MNEQTNEPPQAQPTDATEPTSPTEPTDATEKAPDRARTRLRDRTFGFRGALAVGLAGVVLGGAAGTTITTLVTHDHPERASYHRDLRGGEGPNGGPGQLGGPPGMPPATAPDDGTEPDSSSDSSDDATGESSS